MFALDLCAQPWGRHEFWKGVAACADGGQTEMMACWLSYRIYRVNIYGYIDVSDTLGRAFRAGVVYMSGAVDACDDAMLWCGARGSGAIGHITH